MVIIMTDQMRAKTDVVFQAYRDCQRGAINSAECDRRADLTDEDRQKLESSGITRYTDEKSLLVKIANALYR